MAGHEIAASAAARRDLGPGYDQSAAEELAEWISVEVDHQLRARLAQRRAVESLVPLIASMACGLGATGIVVLATATNVNGRFNDPVSLAQILVVALIWAVVGVVNVVYARRR